MTEFVQEGLHLRALVSRWCRPLHYVLEEDMYMDVFPYDIQGKIALTQEWLDFFKRCSTAELSYKKKDSYQYDHS